MVTGGWWLMWTTGRMVWTAVWLMGRLVGGVWREAVVVVWRWPVEVLCMMGGWLPMMAWGLGSRLPMRARSLSQWWRVMIGRWPMRLALVVPMRRGVVPH